MVCLKLSDFNYDLPKELIAQEPARPRSDSRLMIVNTLHTKNTHHSKTTTESSDSKLADINIKNHINLEHKKFSNIIDYFKKGDVIVINETKVLKALIRGSKSTGAKAQLIITGKRSDGLYICRIATINPHPGAELIFNNGLKAKIIEQKTDIFFVRFNKQNIEKILSKIGELPTPFYITQRLKQDDYYQTVYAKKEGSIAAPTAGLHFTQSILSEMKEKKINYINLILHIGAGTFRPVSSKKVEDHVMHSEKIILSLASLKELYYSNEQFITVGTTSMRTIESIYWAGNKILNGIITSKDEIIINQWDPYENVKKHHPGKVLQALINFLEDNKLEYLNAMTSIIILPGYDFKLSNGLITNFHMPKSTLIMLIAAFIGDNWKKVYNYALENNYRFLSYGDSSLLLP